jgi:Trk K+ transport system NAD-binding subunit
MKEKMMMGAGILMLLTLVSGYHGSVGWTQAALAMSFLAFIIKSALAIWIYLRNPYAKVNKSFAIVFMGQAVWDLGKFVMWLMPDEASALFWARVSYTGYIISVFFLFGFVWAYLKKKNYFTTVPGRIVLYAPMVLLLLSLWLGKGVISELIPPEQLPYGLGIELWSYSYGPVYNHFFLWFQIIPFVYAFVLFVIKYFTSQRPDKKKQVLYLVVGSAFPIMIGIPTGVILPAMGINLPPHNNLLSLIMSIFIAIGIIKYKFLSIQPVGETIIPGRKFAKEIYEDYKLEYGHCHLIKKEDSCDVAHEILLSHLYKRKYGLIITAHNPAKIRHEHGIDTTPIVWVTDTETEHLAIDPIDIEQLYETIVTFIRRVPNAIVLLDGLDYLLAHNNFAKILHFIRQVKQAISKSDDCLIVPQGTLSLDPKQQKLFEAEFIILPKGAGRMRAQREIKEHGRKNYIIIGHNPLAQSIISEFERRQIKPVIVDKKDVLVHYPKGKVNIMKGDPLSSKVLLHAGIHKPNTVVLITLENDSEVILCINKIRQLSDSVKIITNIHNPQFLTIAIKAGADKVIPSSSIGGRLISLSLTSPEIVRWVMDATTLATKELELAEIAADIFVGKTVGKADDMLGNAGNVIAVKTFEGLQQIPDDDYVLKPGDSLILVVNLETLPKGKNITERVARLVKKGAK